MGRGGRGRSVDRGVYRKFIGDLYGFIGKSLSALDIGPSCFVACFVVRLLVIGGFIVYRESAVE